MNKSGIHIKKGNEGKFTEQANRAGMGVQEFASHVLANKDDYNESTIKRAQFAKNATKFKHEQGNKIIIKQDGGEIMPFKKTWEQIKKTASTLGNDVANAYVDDKFTKDSTYYRNNVQPILFGESKELILPKAGVKYGEKLTDAGVPNYDRMVNSIETMIKTPKRPGYKEFFKW